MNLGGFFDLDGRQKKVEELNKELSKPNIWNDHKSAAALNKSLSYEEKLIKKWNNIQDNTEALVEISESISEVEVDEMLPELNSLTSEIDNLEIETALSKDEDKLGAILTIHPGAGGTESCDWAGMLLRMYRRFFEKNKWKYKIIDIQAGDEAGIKDVTIEIPEEMAYGYLKSEIGIHRLVRISPFDSAKRRHTSFVSIFLYPLINEEIEIEIEDKDLRIDFFRASGPGGQNVNKVSSAVRITHIPSRIVVQSQSERSQVQNRQNAMKVLMAKLYQKKLDEEKEKKNEVEKKKTDIAWGHQIRSYVFTPYTQVKDHRTKKEVGDVQKIMNGDIEMFIRAYLLF